MPQKETLKDFSNNIKKFPKILNRRVVDEWQKYTEEAFSLSLERVPILSANLANSGSFKKATITAQGIESAIVYTMPYANYIEGGKTAKGKPLNYKEVGEKSGPYTKAQKGQAKFLESSVEDEYDSAIEDVKKAISEAWALI